jgi:cellulose synthase/poly-beta-1,6-N-acetylglucosamine synthase-like glycosyltransferase
MTLEFVFGLLLLYFFLLYAIFLLKVLSGLATPATPPALSRANQFVSVIIAVRNEENAIGRCLESILAQDYPRDHYEIITVDDGSSDQTRAIITQFQHAHSTIRLIVHSEPSAPGNKRMALLEGIKEAKGDILLFTDGDCTAKPGWISGMSAALREPVSFAAGPVVEIPAPGILQKLSRIEFLGLIGVAAGLLKAGAPIFCNGANIAYRKTDFEAQGGFGPDSHFSDDEAVLQRFHLRNKESVAFVIDPAAVVSTQSPRDLRSFWMQRVRWSSKRGAYDNKSILVRLTGLYLFFVIAFCGIALSVQFPSLLKIVVPVLAAKFLLDWLVIRKAAALLEQSASLWHLFIAEVLHVPYIVLAAFQGQIGSLRWKGAPVRS